MLVISTISSRIMLIKNGKSPHPSNKTMGWAGGSGPNRMARQLAKMNWLKQTLWQTR